MKSKQDEIPLQEVIYNSVTEGSSALKREGPNSTSYFLFIAAGTANLLSFTTGTIFGWTSPVIPKLLTLEDNPIGRPITPFEQSWIAGLPCLGGIFGPLIAGYMADKFGRKKTLLLFSLPIMFSFLVAAYANTVLLYYVCRLVGGIGTASTFTVLPIYLAEIAENHNRGTIGCSLGLFLSFGFVFAFSVGPYVTIRNFCLLCAVPCIIFIPVFSFWIPETPQFLASINKDQEAKISLEKLRDKTSEDLKLEYFQISKTVVEDAKAKSGLQDLLKQKSLRRGLIVILGIMLIQQFSGINAVMAYMQNIFDATGSGFSPQISTIIIGVIQMFTNITTSFLVDKLGRRILLLVSVIGSCFSLFALGLYFYLKINNFNVDVISWMPVASLVCYIVFFNSGLGPVPWAIMAELFPTNVRSMAATITTVVCFSGSFIITFIFPGMVIALGMAKSFWMFSIVCVGATVFIYVLLPETKGKSMQEIQKLLQGKR